MSHVTHDHIEWPGHWTKTPPTVEQHPPCRYLAWLVRGHPFNGPVLARTNVGVRIVRKRIDQCAPAAERYVVVQILADGFHGLHLNTMQPEVSRLEWLGPILIPAGDS